MPGDNAASLQVALLSDGHVCVPRDGAARPMQSQHVGTVT